MLAAVYVLFEISGQHFAHHRWKGATSNGSILPVVGSGRTVAKIDRQLAAVSWGTFLRIGCDGELVGKPVYVCVGDLSSPIVRPPHRQMTQEGHQKKEAGIL